MGCEQCSATGPKISKALPAAPATSRLCVCPAHALPSCRCELDRLTRLPKLGRAALTHHCQPRLDRPRPAGQTSWPHTLGVKASRRHVLEKVRNDVVKTRRIQTSMSSAPVTSQALLVSRRGLFPRGDCIPCLELPRHSFWGVKDIRPPRGMLAAVLRDLQEATFLGLE